ncbi:hypothetical protein [Paenibacillus sp. MSJ-34]|uniref:hypothetical protein n=1 Tax=Paenibacillus sp. MSJ-34 TaxID=2841529 RepID=UPI001C12726D|nr:hypothetical protein [Paenibacillus sp. MSJ-34]MBU5442127.1 hypothetical protein [Paenibacillus sp. MSJ-34]CAH0117555.1 hypothetical protein PAE9249_00011 [Paenibacillus sp. CECT 9249]
MPKRLTNERLDALMLQEKVYGLRIISSVEEHFVYRAHDQTDGIMLRGRLKSRIQGQIVLTVRRRDHIQVVTVKVFFSGAVPT